jgi:hypothetical protein
MNRNQAQRRISEGLRVFAYSTQYGKRFELRSIGVGKCYSTCGKELTIRQVEFGV